MKIQNFSTGENQYQSWWLIVKEYLKTQFCLIQGKINEGYTEEPVLDTYTSEAILYQALDVCILR